MDLTSFNWIKFELNTDSIDGVVTVQAHYFEAQVSIVSVVVGKLVFSGNYKTGTPGNADADFVTESMKQALVHTPIGGLVVDFTDMAYQWGNRIWQSRQLLQHASIPNVIICSEKNQALMMGNSDFFTTEESAMQHLLHYLNS